jgi:hypothetical protein
MQLKVLFCASAFIDIEKVIDDVDLHVLEENLANISLCDITQEMVRRIMMYQDFCLCSLDFGGMQLNAGVWGHGIELAPSPSPSVHSPCTAPWSGLDLRVGRRNVDLKMLRNVDIL